MKRHTLDSNDLRQRYVEGASVKALAERYGVARSVVDRTLRDIGLTPRTRSEAMSVRMAQTSPAERRQLAAAAQQARRSGTVSEEEVAAKARWREGSRRFASPRELELAALLSDRGVETVPQVAVGRYNLDLAIDGRVAVELHRSSANPARHLATRKRAEYLLDRGWSVIYVWVNGSFVLAGEGADEVVAFAKESEGLPSGACQYRVVRGTGEHVHSHHFNPDEIPFIAPPKAHLKTRRHH